MVSQNFKVKAITTSTLNQYNVGPDGRRVLSKDPIVIITIEPIEIGAILGEISFKISVLDAQGYTIGKVVPVKL